VAVLGAAMMLTLALALASTAVCSSSNPVAITQSVSSCPAAPATIATKLHSYESRGWMVCGTLQLPWPFRFPWIVSVSVSMVKLMVLLVLSIRTVNWTWPPVSMKTAGDAALLSRMGPHWLDWAWARRAPRSSSLPAHQQLNNTPTAKSSRTEGGLLRSPEPEQLFLEVGCAGITPSPQHHTRSD
jgi:hypothetical protein